jgi:multidrug efflux pump subunit AcrA (membrane-fusion protein)
MTTHLNNRRLTLFVLLAAALSACGDERPSAPAAAGNQGDPAPTNRVAIPTAVRQNLGISFVTAERRRIAKTLRVPGRFEHDPSAVRLYNAPIDGRVRLLVALYDYVDPGTPLFRLDAPEWRELQQELEDALIISQHTRRRIAAETDRIHSIHQEISGLRDRLDHLEKLDAAGGGRASDIAETKLRLNQAHSQLAQAEADLSLAEAESIRLQPLDNPDLPNPSFTRALQRAASWTGLSSDQLLATLHTPDGPQPRWRVMNTLEIVAARSGRVEFLDHSGEGWARAGDLILRITDPDALIFRANGLQSDIGLLRDGQRASIAPPQGGSLHLQDSVEAELQIGVQADPRTRTIDLLLSPRRLPAWARHGMAAFAEIVVDETAREEVAIPLSSIVSDGLEPIFFLRDRLDPDQVVRVVADLGLHDGRWVAIRSGIKAGDEVVLDGAYELKLSGSGKAAQGGHFHADGAFHEAHE